jgi:hypothetical protein
VLQKAVGPLGGRSAALDGAVAIAAILGPPLAEDQAAAGPERALGDACRAAFAACGGVGALTRLAGAPGPPAAAAAACAGLLAEFGAAGGAAVRGLFAAAGGIEAMVRVLGNLYVELPSRAAAAGCLWHYLMPDARNAAPPGETTAATLKRTQARSAAKESGKGGTAAAVAGMDLVRRYRL